MEKVDLKSIWKKHTDKKIENDFLSEEELRKIKFVKSKSLIRKIRNGVLFDFVGAAVMVVLLSYFLFKNLPLVIEILIIAFDLIYLFLVGFYFQYLKTVQRSKLEIYNLKESLSKFIEETERILRFLFVITVIVIPLAALFGYIFGFYYGSEEAFNEAFTSARNMILMPIIILVIGLLGIPLTKYYLKFLYGRHIKKLKKTLEELNQNGID